jgi:hypothetical protein
MNDNQVVIGIFENELYAIIAKRDLRTVGIRAKILKSDHGKFLPLLNQAEEVQLMVTNTRIEEAKKNTEDKI